MKFRKQWLIAAAGGVVSLAISTGLLAADMTLKFAGVLPVEHYAHKMMEQIGVQVS